MSIFRCKMCGGTLEIQNNESVATCEYCGTKQTLPRLDDEKRANLYDRANQFRRNNEFDKAAALYEQIVAEDASDAEAYWSLVLCRYGIEYVEDPATHKRVPTVNRAQFTSIYADTDYQAALDRADGYQKVVYEEEAKAIDDIQKGILAISQKEEPFDVFICYKETDHNGRRTPDSVLANDLYHQLTQEGFKVFFARITLEDKLGSAYEPYIFAALHSAKAMVVLGTKPEYFNAVWVKNEWSRFLALTKDGKKTLIPAYKDMDPYDLPREFANLQAQDMSKLGFMQDLIRGIKKLVEQPAQSFQTTTVHTATEQESGNDKTLPLMKRAFIFLEDANWSDADAYCEKVLDLDPENAQAYLCKMMIELRITHREDLGKQEQSFENNSNFQRAKRYANSAFLTELNGYITSIYKRKEDARKELIYQDAIMLLDRAGTKAAVYEEAYELFSEIYDYKDSSTFIRECENALRDLHSQEVYNEAIICAKGNTIERQQEAITLFESIRYYQDSEEQIVNCKREIDRIKFQIEQEKMQQALVAEEQRRAALYKGALSLLHKAQMEQECLEARAIFESLGGYEQARAMVARCDEKILDIQYGPIYEKAILLGKTKDISSVEEAIVLLETIVTFKDASAKIDEYKSKMESLRKNEIYVRAIALLKSKDTADLTRAKELFESIESFVDSHAMITVCDEKILDIQYGPIYEKAILLGKTKDISSIEEAIALLESVTVYKDASKRINEYKNKIELIRKNEVYVSAIALLKSKDTDDFLRAKELFESLETYKDARNYAATCEKKLARLQKSETKESVVLVGNRKKKVGVAIGFVACLLILCVVTVFVIMPSFDDNGGDVVVSLPSNEQTAMPTNTTLDIETPVSTTTPRPTATKTPSPTATKTPRPTATKTPSPTATKTPSPTATPKPVQYIPSNVAVGNVVKFGFYEQDNNISNGQEAIEWIVLDKKDGKALLISKYALDSQPYNTSYTSVTWETCTLRSWLNSTFYTTAFNVNQQSMIVSTTLTNPDNPCYGTEGGNNTTDKVFLLSIDEAKQYFSTDSARICTPTAYAKAQGVLALTNGSSFWWLRSPGIYSNRAAYVAGVGSVYDGGYVVYIDDIAVRPALWINLES